MKTIEAPAAERVSTPIFEQLREEFGFTQLIAEIEQDDPAEDPAEETAQAEESDEDSAATEAGEDAAVTEAAAVDVADADAAEVEETEEA
ncbi:hypothetical protein [Amycolatopsis palatopharyngis]|uniref:hypothetical protein n=1 Tax=Amycolatopsis palatopharyngis TaxID=187982 RepID=UPI000E24E2CD|nr:hypothetical protein [Amycolatopsis palatopharyngis]